ncbi:MAG: hypothetical protein LBL45_00410 [Treponema sp.]|jgi:hypothetical protein|nr:hypothetical protein [Treponema sp.]
MPLIAGVFIHGNIQNALFMDQAVSRFTIDTSGGVGYIKAMLNGHVNATTT